jgi:ABC-2 type transport system permease protein
VKAANLFGVMVWKEFQQLRRDKAGLRLMIMVPLVQMVVLGYALTTEVKHTPVAVLDHDRSPASRSLIEAVAHNDLFRFRGHAASEADLRRRLDQGEIKLALILPPDFTEDLEKALPRSASGGGAPAALTPGAKSPDGAQVQLWVDGQDANSAGVARGYLGSVLNQWGRSRMEARLAAQGIRLDQVLPLKTEVKVLFNPQLKSTWYMIPGVAVILITMVTALLTGFSIVREKEAGTLEQLMVTPLKPMHVVVGKTLPFFLVGLVELMVALALAQLWFKVPFRGSYLALVAFSATYMLSSLGIGIFTSTVARTQQQALFVIWFFLLFFLLLSGFFMPIENMPPWVQHVTMVNPVRWFMHVLREMFLKGSGFAELWREGLAMLAIGCTVFSMAVLKFNRRLG